jgi:hypothetical protein
MAERILMADPENPHLGGNIKDGDEMTYFPEIWDFIIEKYNPRSICDVGCGDGQLINYFHNKGIEVHGIDGLPVNKVNAPEAIRGKIHIHDYTLGIGPLFPVDITISCEFVEHVDQKYIGNYMLQFCNCKTLIFTHALPGQPGYHHVTCRKSDYWIEIMKLFDFQLSLNNCHARKLAHDKGKILWETVLIFERNGR